MSLRCGEAVAKAKPGQWVRVIPNWGPDYERVDEFRGQHGQIWEQSIRKEYLDILAPNNPVCISNGFTSACMSNTKALEEYRSVHSDLDAQDEQSAVLGRKMPSDVVLKGKVPLLAELLKAELELWARYGITAYGSAPYAYTNLQALNILDQRGDLPARYAWTWHDAVAPKGWGLGHAATYVWRAGTRVGLLMVYRRFRFFRRLHVDPGETRVDGAVGSQPASLIPIARSAATLPARLGMRGMWRSPSPASGLPQCIHRGTKGIDYVMDAIEEGSRRAGMTPEEIRSKRHAFDHSAGAPRPGQIPRLKNLGMMTSMLNTILWETHRGASQVARQFGVEYTNWVVPRKSVADAGIMNTFEIDRPLPHKVFFFVTKGMNRYNDRDQQVYGPGERTDRITQLKALTTWGGYYLLREKPWWVGWDRARYADFLVLDRDFLTIPEAEIPQTQVLMTVVGGKTVHLGAALAGEIGMQPVGPSTWTEPIPEGWEPKAY